MIHEPDAGEPRAADPLARYELLGEHAAAAHASADYAAAEEHLAAMAVIAAALGDLPRQVDVLARRVRAAVPQGRAAAMRAQAEAVLAAAEAAHDRAGAAQCRAALAEVAFRTGDYAATREAALAALAAFEADGSRAGAARMRWVLAASEREVGHADSARTHAEAALDLYRALGDRRGEADALNVLGLASADYARRRDAYEQALALFAALGDRERQATVGNNLGNVYLALGVYGHARALLEQAAAADRAMGAGYGLAYDLDSLAWATLAQGDARAAEQVWHEARDLARAGGVRPIEAFCALGLGQAALAQGRSAEAARHFHEAAERFGELGMGSGAAAALAWRAAASLAQGRTEDAREQSAAATALLERGGENVVLSPQYVWWWRYRALAAGPADDGDEAFLALHRARGAMLAQVAELSDPGLRRCYLTRVAVNRSVAEAWAEEAARRGLSPSLAAPERASGLQEQLARLLAISRRLSAQHDPEALREFVLDELVELTGAELLLMVVRVADPARPEEAHEEAEARGVGESALGALRAAAAPLIDEALALGRPLLRESGERSVMVAPLVAGGRPVGAIYADIRPLFGPFTARDLDMLGLLAGQAAVALENARLFQETRRANRELERRVQERTAELRHVNTTLAQRAAELAVVNEVSEALASQLEFETVVDLLGDRLRTSFRSDGIMVALLDERAGLVRFPYAYEHGRRQEQPPTLRLGEGLTSEVLLGRRPLLIGTAAEAAAHGMVHYGTIRTQSWLGVPLMVGDQLIGALSVHTTRPQAYSESDVQVLTTIAANVGVALQNARLYSETRRRAREMTALAAVGSDISATLDLPTVLGRIAGHARELLAADTSAVFLAEPGGGALRAIAALGADADAIRQDTIPFGAGIIGDLAQRGAAEIIPDTGRDPRTRVVPGTVLHGEEQLMVAPLLAGARVTGMMAVWRFGRDPLFAEADLSFLVGLARQAAIAIENARLFAEAEAARAEAEAASRAKSSFLANMSHELRTPLNAVLGFAQVLERDRELAPRHREHLAIITRSGEHLLSLINDVLELSKIEAGRLTLNESAFDLRALLDGLRELFRLRAESKGLELEVAVAPEVPRYVSGDEGKLRQILINLLGNAVKFTHQGAVSLEVALAGRPDPGGAWPLRFSVTDTGEGIAPEELARLFQAFSQAAGGLRSLEGSGLGLAIARQFARLMGGDITVASAPGVGSTFRADVRLAPSLAAPAAPARARRALALAPESQGDWRVLVADDRADNRRLMAEWLGAVGLATREAADGAEAIRIWHEWRPQLVWMDMRMPVLDGYEATRRIKSAPGGADTVVIAFTASVFEHEQELVRRAGCDDVLRKPAREADVFAALSRHLGISFVYDEPEGAQAAAPERPPASLAPLPAELRGRLREAVAVADMEQVAALIDEVRGHSPTLAGRLAQLAAEYRIDQLLELAQAPEE